MLNRLTDFVRGILGRRRAQQEADDELAFHLEQETTANIARGMPPTEARRAALAGLGGLAQTREAVRDVRWLWIDDVWQDVRYSVRMLRRSPGFAAVAVLVLALGIGVNTAAFSITNAIFFKPLPVSDPDRLLYIYRHDKQSERPFATTYADVLCARQLLGSIADVTDHLTVPRRFSADGETDIITGEYVGPGYFEVLGVPARLGRRLGLADANYGGTSTESAVVISHEWWQRRFGSDPSVIGKRVHIDQAVFTIVGVMPPGFVGLSDPWAPTRFWAPGWSRPDVRSAGVARPKPGVSVAQVQAAVAARSPKQIEECMLANGYLYRKEDLTMAVISTGPHVAFRAADIRTPYDPEAQLIPRRLTLAVTVVMGVVLVICSANIAGMLLARSVTRRGELAMRRTLGAGAFRLVRQLLTEQVVLGLSGGLAGGLLAWLLLRLYAALTPNKFLVEAPIDGSVIAFTTVTCLGIGMLIGVAPARQAWKVKVLATLSGGTTSTAPLHRRLRLAVVVPQVALAFTLLAVAGVHVRALRGIETTELGYKVDSRLVVTIGYTGPQQSGAASSPEVRKALGAMRPIWDEQSRVFYEGLFRRLRAVPGIADFGVAPEWGVPFTTRTRDRDIGPGVMIAYVTEGMLRSGNPQGVRIRTKPVSPGYLSAMGLSLEGRDFNENDGAAAPAAAIVSRAAAAHLWPGENPLGQILTDFEVQSRRVRRVVVGVVNDVDTVLERGTAPLIYVPLRAPPMWAWQSYPLVISFTNPADVVAGINRAVRESDPDASVARVQTMDDALGDLLFSRRAAAWILMASGLLGLALAVVGLYGVISYSVAQRVREMGIRAALGARRVDLVRLVLTDGMVVAVLGILPGIWLARVALRATSTLVATLPTMDYWVFGTVGLTLLAVTLAASYVPARRAARLDPMQALRSL